jgi:hypothetical protein
LAFFFEISAGQATCNLSFKKQTIKARRLFLLKGGTRLAKSKCKHMNVLFETIQGCSLLTDITALRAGDKLERNLTIWPS